MNGDYSNNATFERPPREGNRALLFPENKTLEEALSRLDDVSLDKDNELYEELAEDLFPDKDEESLRELRRDAVRRVEEEIVSHAKFLLPIDVWEEDLTRLADGSQAVRDGIEYDKCVINREGAFFPEAAYLPLFTDWDSLYKGPYPGAFMPWW